MSNCVKCKDPPGGEVCCDDGLTPVCIVKKGKAYSHCLNIKKKTSENARAFHAFVVKAIIKLIPKNYAQEFSTNFVVEDGLGSFSSSDGYIQVTVQNIAMGTRGATT